MQGVEALTLMIRSTDDQAALLKGQFDLMSPDGQSMDAEAHDYKGRSENLSLAAAVGQAIMNTALPIARYRAFVEIDKDQPKRTKLQDDRAVHEEFTVCAINMSGILSGLMGVTWVPTNVKVTVWEQRQTGADMISGYQGTTRTGEYRSFLKGLVALESMPTVQ